MKIFAILLALIFWTAPLFGAMSVECTCELSEGAGSSWDPVPCCEGEAEPCCFEVKTPHGDQPLALEREQKNRVEWKSGFCLGEHVFPEPVVSEIWKSGAVSSRGPPVDEVDAQSHYQVWLI